MKKRIVFIASRLLQSYLLRDHGEIYVEDGGTGIRDYYCAEGDDGLACVIGLGFFKGERGKGRRSELERWNGTAISIPPVDETFDCGIDLSLKEKRRITASAKCLQLLCWE